MNSRSLGFTLLEVMLAMVIVASIASLVIVSLPNGSQQLRRSLDILKVTIETVSDNAMIHGKPFGITFQQKGYSVHKLNTKTNTWELFNNTVRFPEGSIIEFKNIDEISLTPSQKQQIPHILFWSDGTIVPFNLSVKSEQVMYEVSVNSIAQTNIQIIQ